VTAPLPAALRAHARGVLSAEAAAELLIAHRCWLRRADFTGGFVEVGIGVPGVTETAAVDWPAAIAALDAGCLPCSAGEGRILRLVASLAAGVPVDLRDALAGLDATNTRLVAAAVRHAGGHPPKLGGEIEGGRP
jgi:hypothetical protein